jgi:DNA-binding response OmpR family regulator
LSQKKRILLIEDDPSIIALLKDKLADQYILAVGKNGRTGLNKAWANTFDLILLDIELGDISGFTICKKLKHHPSTQDVPVIIISALGALENTMQGFESGAADYVHKPFHTEELLKRIEVHIKMKDLNSRLQTQADRNKKSKKEFSSFISSLAHELRSPLNSIIGFSEILTDPDLDEENKKQFLQYINQGGHNLLRLLNDLIDFSKIEADNLSIHFSKVNIDKELQELVNHYNDEIHRYKSQDLKLVFNADPNEKDLVVFTDIVRFIQIIRNFIENAIKFSDKGKIEVGYLLDEFNRVGIYVKDEGIGMSQKEVDELFEMDTFSGGLIQLQKSGKGLGMAVSHRLTEMIGGEIEVESEEGKGSKFSLLLPKNFTNSEDTESEIQSYDWKEKQILIAEDVMVNFLFYQALFKKTHVELIHAKNGLEVLELLNENNPDLILMDMVMPKMDGLEATLEVRKKYPHIPIIAQSSVNSREDKENIYRAGCNDIISKPIKPHILLNKVHRFID